MIVSPEQLMKPNGVFESLFRKAEFTRNIISIIFDEAHCISSWGDFRPEYKEVGRLRFNIPETIPFAIVSATLPTNVLSEVLVFLRVNSQKLERVVLSNDRPNINLVVRKLKFSANSFRDLAFLIPDNIDIDHPPPKFVIFFDSKQEAVHASTYLRSRLPPDLRENVKWFIADMTAEFKEDEAENLNKGKTWGLGATDSFGMVRLQPFIAQEIRDSKTMPGD